MKFKRSFFAKTVLTAILLTLTTVSVNAKDYGEKNHVEVREVLAAKPAEQGHSAKSKNEGFLAKHTTELEFTVAILVIVGGLATSEILQRNREQKQFTKDEGNEIYMAEASHK